MDHDRSASVAAMLTAAMRSQLPLAPAFNISASMSGSGKSYLAGLIALFAGPGQPMNVSYPVKAEEAGKAILTMLMTQPAVVLFDDMQTNWIPHSIINRMLTSEYVSDRKLGGNESAKVSTATLVLGKLRTRMTPICSKRQSRAATRCWASRTSIGQMIASRIAVRLSRPCEMKASAMASRTR